MQDGPTGAPGSPCPPQSGKRSLCHDLYLGLRGGKETAAKGGKNRRSTSAEREKGITNNAMSQVLSTTRLSPKKRRTDQRSIVGQKKKSAYSKCFTETEKKQSVRLPYETDHSHSSKKVGGGGVVFFFFLWGKKG